jgi:AraC-like DNA-binding protein
MIDPLAEVVSLLQPSAPSSTLIEASAPWAMRRSETGCPTFSVVLQGSLNLTIDGATRSDTMTLQEGDFVLIPATRNFATSSLDQQPPGRGQIATTPIRSTPGRVRIGDPNSAVDVRILVGNYVFASPEAALLVSLLPEWVHVHGERRLSTLVDLVGDESRMKRPARDIVVARLLEVLMIEALRSTASTAASPGLARGLSDARLSKALRRMHERPAEPWTVAQLAQAAAMSRSAFFERFSDVVGVKPMEYLLAWRMALAKQMLRRQELTMADIAERVGYSSVSTFGVAFTRHVGMPPGRYARSTPIT